MGSEFMPAKLCCKFFYLIKSCFIRYFVCYPIMFRSISKSILNILSLNLTEIRPLYVLRSALKHKTKIIFLVWYQPYPPYTWPVGLPLPERPNFVWENFGITKKTVWILITMALWRNFLIFVRQKKILQINGFYQ